MHYFISCGRQQWPYFVGQEKGKGKAGPHFVGQEKDKAKNAKGRPHLADLDRVKPNSELGSTSSKPAAQQQSST